VLIPDVDDLVLIGQRLRILYYGVAFVCITCFIIMIIGRSNKCRFYLLPICVFFFCVTLVFRRLPPTPPSRAQEHALQMVEQNYGRTLKRLITNRWFLLLLLSYGMFSK
jgi:hypothetical protein